MNNKPYVVEDIDNNRCINIYREGIEVFRLVRRDIWNLHQVENGKLLPKVITKNQYRNDLIERIQLGKYDNTEND